MNLQKKFIKKLAKLKIENTSKKDIEHKHELETLRKEVLHKDHIVESLKSIINENNEKIETIQKD